MLKLRIQIWAFNDVTSAVSFLSIIVLLRISVDNGGVCWNLMVQVWMWRER